MPPPCTIARLTCQPPRHEFVRLLPRSASSAKRAAGKRFSPFYSIPPSSSDPPSFSFSPFSEMPSPRMSHLPFHIRLRLWYFSPAVVYVSPGFSTDVQILFRQIKSLSRRLKVFARGGFKVQFLDAMNKVPSDVRSIKSFLSLGLNKFPLQHRNNSAKIFLLRK